MLTLRPNTANFIGRSLLLPVVIILEYVLIKFGLNDPKSQKVLFKLTDGLVFRTSFLFHLLIVLMVFFAFTVVMSFLSINKVYFYPAENTITFVRPFGKMTMSLDDIQEYFRTVHKNSIKSWYGLSLTTKGGKRINLTGQNIKSLEALTAVLQAKRIHFGGERNMSFPFN